MKKILYSSVLALGCCLTFTQCDMNDYLSTSSPAIMSDDFVTSTPAETWKTMAFYYDRYRGSVAGGGNYNWNDPCSDCEYYPEANSNNGRMGYLDPEKYSISGGNGQFNALFEIIARASRVATILREKEEYKTGVASGQPTIWTHLYGENMTMYAWCYLELVRHFGDVPFGLENKIETQYNITSRFEILDNIIAIVKEVEPLMFDLGQQGLNAERMTRTFANEVIAEANLVAGSFTTIRTDVPGLYGDVQFETKYQGAYSKNAAVSYAYVRRVDYQKYYQEAQKYFRNVLGVRKGTLSFITVDERAFSNNPFQRGFQYMNDKQVSPESIWEVGNQKGNQSERPYSQGRPSNGGKPACPPKVFGGIRITPVFYYTGYEDGDQRWDPSCVVTGSDGSGNEAMVSFLSGSKLSGGIACNKWDDNRMNPPKVDDQRKSGMNYVMRRLANTMLMLAEVDAELGETAEALQQLNTLRNRAGLPSLPALAGDALKDAVTLEVQRELVGEGEIRRHEIRRGVFPERALAYRAELKKMISSLEQKGYYTFANGRTISNYIWTKLVTVSIGTLTYDRDESNPALTPGWRGLYDYSTIPAVKDLVKGTNHNLAIKGLFEYIDPNGDEAKALEADGYKKTNWGVDFYTYNSETGIYNTAPLWDYNQMGGIEFANAGLVPLWFMPLPRATITQSGEDASTVSGYTIWNGYGLPQE